jgi:hypothetical protein
MVAGPAVVADETLADLAAQSGGFGVSGTVPEFLEDRVRGYLAADGAGGGRVVAGCGGAVAAG